MKGQVNGVRQKAYGASQQPASRRKRAVFVAPTWRVSESEQMESLFCFRNSLCAKRILPFWNYAQVVLWES